MSTNYYRQYSDLDNILEPKKSSAPSPDFSGYNISGSAMTNRFQAAATNSWAQNITTFFSYQGSSIIACKIGCFPYPTYFCAITSGSALEIGIKHYTNEYSEHNDEDYLQIGNNSYFADSFRNNHIPEYIGVLLTGGGGGGGGRGCAKGDKSGWNAQCGGSGGGAGTGSFVLNVKNYTYWLTIGSGGSGGAGGSSSSRPSNGSNGTDGGNTTLWVNSSCTEYACYAMGGGGGQGAKGGSSDGNGGSGRNAYYNTSYENIRYFDKINTVGSPGNHCQNGGSTSVSLSRKFADSTSVPNILFFSRSATSYYNGSSGNSYKDGYTDGGPSYGVGGRSSMNNGTTSPGYGGGGGGNGSGNGQAGGGGQAIFYY